MRDQTKMSIFFISLLFVVFSTLLEIGAATGDCTTRCRKHGPKIRFPFRVRTQQPEHCGYRPGFDVDCDDKGDTVLTLPSSVIVVVERIDYEHQQIHLSDPGKCITRKIQDLNLSASPFNFVDSVSNFTLFSCTDPKQEFILVACLGEPGFEVYAIPDDMYTDSLSLTSCTSYQNNLSAALDVFSENELRLNWSEPACGRCETLGGRCINGNVTGDQFQCNMHKASKGAIIAGATGGSLLLLISFTTLILLCIKIIKEKKNQKKVETFLEDYRALKPTRFCYSDIRRITNEFSERLGEGGYGTVYKGKLSSEISVAVKVLNNSKENGEEFVNEVSTIGRIHHVNVVRLVGFCAEGFRRVLVYEFLPNDSLEKIIFQTESKRSSLGWQKLHDIAMGIAKGIEYLHEGCDQQILHFDIKPHNILLDHNFTPKVCDFGLAKLCSKEQSGVTMTAARGTMGYIAPEVLSRTFGKVSYKSDVYSFGMLLLEMVGGRKNVDPKVDTSRVYFPQWVYNHLNLGDDFWAEIEEGDHGSIARKLTIVGLICIQWIPSDRPDMKAVVQMLESDGEDLTMPTDPFPVGNAVNLVGRIPERGFQAELPLILEVE